MNVARGAIIDGIGRVPYDCTTIIIKVMIKVQLKAPQNKSSVDGPPSKDCSPSGSGSWPCLSDGGSYIMYTLQKPQQWMAAGAGEEGQG